MKFQNFPQISDHSSTEDSKETEHPTFDVRCSTFYEKKVYDSFKIHQSFVKYNLIACPIPTFFPTLKMRIFASFLKAPASSVPTHKQGNHLTNISTNTRTESRKRDKIFVL
eukprot:Pompholyxophrys_punicea_v1_NODE_407_length_2037_cov_2.347124.p1 type:complete len:111 gc:universal NODE_407_length_2037_cov_2.347124:333-665(+)